MILSWAGFVARFGNKTTQKDSVKVRPREISCEDRNCMEVTQDPDQCARLNTTLNFQNMLLQCQLLG